MLEELKRLITVPEGEIHADESQLINNQSSLGLEFPKDFIEFSRCYGSGTLSVGCYDWIIYSSCSSSFLKLVDDFRYAKGEYRDAMETYDIPLGLHPEPGGLLPFAARDDVYFTWKTDGPPDTWKVVVIWTYDENGYQCFDLNFEDFWLSLLNCRIQVAGYDASWDPKQDIQFIVDPWE